MHQIAEKLTEGGDIFRLGLNLNLDHDRIKSILTNNPNNITTAAEEMLHEWYRRQDNPNDFCRNLGEALIKSNFNMIATTVLDYKPTGRSNGNKDKKSSSIPSASYETQETGIEVKPEVKRKRDTKKTHGMGNEAKAEVKSSKRKDNEEETDGKGTSAAIEVETAKSKYSAKKAHEPRAEAELKSVKISHSTSETHLMEAGNEDKVKLPKQKGNTKKIRETAVEAKFEAFEEFEVKAGKRKRRRKKTHGKGGGTEEEGVKEECSTNKTHEIEADGKVELEATNGKRSEEKTCEVGTHTEKKSAKTKGTLNKTHTI